MLKNKSGWGHDFTGKELYCSAKKEAFDIKFKNVAKIYRSYQKHLEDNNSLDFDDLLVKTLVATDQAIIYNTLINNTKDPLMIFSMISNKFKELIST